MDFPSVVKYLDYNKARTITSDEADSARPPLSKYQRYNKSRAIKKLLLSLQLNAHSVAFGSAGFIGQLMFQYNLTFSENFYITNIINAETIVVGGCLAVKYRIGSDVFRYALIGSQQAISHPFFPPTVRADVFNFPVYNGEFLYKNCCFEFWINSDTADPHDPVGVMSNLIIESSRLVNPATADETERIVMSIDAIDRADFAVALPETLPYTQDIQVWLDNP